MNLEEARCYVKSVNEYNVFKELIKFLQNNDVEALRQSVLKMTPLQSSFVKKVLQSQRITVREGGKTTEVVRKVIKVKRKPRGAASE